MPVTISAARGDRDILDVRTLFCEYANGLALDLAYQGFVAELAGLPGKYTSPAGALFLARRDAGSMLGCVGVRPFEGAGACEIKRLYVRASARGTGAGRALAEAALIFAAASGYRDVLLDTLPSMQAAISIYRALGFVPIERYWNDSTPGVLYFGKRLS